MNHRAVSPPPGPQPDLGPVAGIPSRAGGNILGLRVSALHGGGAGRGVSQSARRGIPGRRRTGSRRREHPRRAGRKPAVSGRRRQRARVRSFRLRTGRADLLIAISDESGKGGQAPFAGTALGVLRTKGACPPFPPIEYRFDPTRPESVLARHAADDFLQRAAGRQDLIATRDHEANEPGGRYIDFLVPGLLGMGLMGGGLWGVGYAIVDMRIRKLLKRYLATPMKPQPLPLLGHHQPAVVHAARGRPGAGASPGPVFGVASAGSYGTIALLIVLGSLEFSGIGLLVASRAQTIETVSGLMNAVMLPMYIGSGIFFSIERFPDAVQPALQLLPLTPLDSRAAERDAGRAEPVVAGRGSGDGRSLGRRDVRLGPAVVPLEVKLGHRRQGLAPGSSVLKFPLHSRCRVSISVLNRPFVTSPILPRVGIRLAQIEAASAAFSAKRY